MVASLYVVPDAVRQIVAPDGDDTHSDETAAWLSDDGLNIAIGDAGSQIDVALGERYTVPFTAPYPAVIVSLARDIAAYLSTLTQRRQGNVTPENPIVLRYNRALAMLGDLASGKATIATGAGPETSSSVVFNCLPWSAVVEPGFGFGIPSIQQS